MTKLSMHEHLPFDEATTPPRVSTGDLPHPEDVARVITEAYERYRPNLDGVVADYIPALASASPELFGICVAGVRGRSFEIGDVDTVFSIQSVSKPFVFALVCEESGTTPPAIARCEQHRVAVQLADGGGAERRPHHEPTGQRRGDRHDQPRAGRYRGAEVRQGSETGCRGSPAASCTMSEDVYASEAASNMRNQGIAHLLQSYGGSTSIPTRRRTSTPGSARST